MRFEGGYTNKQKHFRIHSHHQFESILLSNDKNKVEGENVSIIQT